MRATPRLEAPCGTVTKTPPLANPWYGFVMQYHPHAPAPAAASTSTRMSSKTFFKSASRIPRAHASLGVLHGLRRLPPVQVFFQNQSRSQCVYACLFVFFLSFFAGRSVNGPALLLLEQPLRFPTRKPLVHHLHGQTKLLVH